MDQYLSCHIRWTLLHFASSDGPDCLDLSNPSKRHHSTIPNPTGHSRRWDLRALISSAAPFAVGHVSSHLPLVSLSSPNPKPPIAISGRWQSTWPKHRGIRRRFLDHSAYEFFIHSLSLSSPPSLTMYILSATPSTTFLTPRVSSSSSLSFSSSFSPATSNSKLRLVPLRSRSRRSSACPCSFYSSSKARAMAELVKDKEEESSLSAVESAQRRETKHSRTFLNVTSEEGASSWENATTLLFSFLDWKIQESFIYSNWIVHFLN